VIAIDSSSVQRTFAGEDGVDTRAVKIALARREAVLSPTVLTEVFTYSGLSESDATTLLTIPLLEILDGYWVRAGLLRREVRTRGLRANLADVLIAQSCIDHDIPLITYDRDFRHFTDAGLMLI
jgi:predicted nucleic acid-binding protein